MSTLDLMLMTIGALGLAVAALSARLRQLPLSEPLLALVLGVILGPAALGVIDLPSITGEHAAIHEASRVLLAISVMGVALRYPVGAARAHWRGVVLLLVVVMPAMALISTGLSMWILGTSFAAALLLGTALCPTDPVLASSVLTGEPAERDLPTALRLGREHGAAEHGPILLFTVLLALMVLGVSGLLHLDGVVAAFTAGMAFNLLSSGSDRRTESTSTRWSTGSSCCRSSWCWG